MNSTTISLKLLIGYLALLALVYTFTAKAQSEKINCSTVFGEKKFILGDKEISLIKENHSGVDRSVSSIQGGTIRTEKKHLGFTKTLYINEHKYIISIKDVNKFSEEEDYLSITGPKGHVMTYPLICSKSST